MNKLKLPTWTVHYNLVSPGSDWIGTGWEFYDNEQPAIKRYTELTELGFCVSMRPYFDKTDRKHLGAADQYNLRPIRISKCVICGEETEDKRIDYLTNVIPVLCDSMICSIQYWEQDQEKHDREWEYVKYLSGPGSFRIAQIKRPEPFWDKLIRKLRNFFRIYYI